MIPRPSTTCDPARRHHTFVDGADLCRCRAFAQQDGRAFAVATESPGAAWVRAVEWAAPWRALVAAWQAS